MPAITLLKRQLALAVKEENYKEAARIRDHSWCVIGTTQGGFLVQAGAQRLQA